MNCYIYPNEANIKLLRVLQRLYLEVSFDGLTRNVSMTAGVTQFGSDEHLSESAKTIFEAIHSTILHHVFVCCTEGKASDFLRQAAHGHLIDQMSIPLTYLSEVKNKLRETAFMYNQNWIDTGDCEDLIHQQIHVYLSMQYRNDLDNFNSVIFEILDMFQSTNPGNNLHAYRVSVTYDMRPQVFCTNYSKPVSRQQYESLCFPG